MSSRKRSHPVSDITPPLRQRNLTFAWIHNPPPSLRSVRLVNDPTYFVMKWR